MPKYFNRAGIIVDLNPNDPVDGSRIAKGEFILVNDGQTEDASKIKEVGMPDDIRPNIADSVKVKSGKTVEIDKKDEAVEAKEVVVEEKVSSLEDKQDAYAEKFGKPAPARFKNDEAWIDSKLKD